MYVNEIPFIITISMAIHFGTAEILKNKKISRHDILEKIIYTYNARGFKVQHILGDGQFECLRKC